MKTIFAKEKKRLSKFEEDPEKNKIKSITSKIASYRSQDMKKKKLSENFVDYEYVENLLNTPTCFYCLEQVKIIYEFVREPKQWTLERIDNTLGHDKGNVVICCLSCNLRRRTMYHERFIFTKQLTIVKDLGKLNQNEYENKNGYKTPE